ncbi:MAG: sigma-70 family RNA polymerase sigma factor [Eubacterium sp.]|nr:sigma-70 family RNA polymerase sigma factor [Eubacterium sp.]
MQPMDEIYRQYARTVYKYLLSLTRDADLAEELTQETFYQAIRSSGRYDGSAKVTTWLCGIAKNVLFSWRRKHKETSPLDDAEMTVESAEDEALSSMGKLELIRLLHGLPEPYREVMYLRAFGGLSFKEIGEVSGKTENWARVTFYRGKEKLKKGSE